MNAIRDEFVIYLEKLKAEIGSFGMDEDLWKITEGINNTPGNLAMHVCGNFKFNIGRMIGGNDYVRTRDNEFAVTGLSKKEVIAEIDSTMEMIEPILDKLTPEDMNKLFPENIHEPGHTTGTVLTKIAHHFGYHLGQINYHRRLITKK